MRNFRFYILALSGVLALCACDKEESSPEPQTNKVILNFSAPLTQIDASAGNPSRAASYLPQNKTVRIIIRKSTEGATGRDMSRPLVADSAYYVKTTNNDLLTECIINPTTYARNTALTSLPIALEPGYYDIYAFSPAIPLDAGDTSVTVMHNVDFMASEVLHVKVGANLSTQKQNIYLPDLKRMCSAMAFDDLYSIDPQIFIKPYAITTTATFGRPGGFFIDNLYKYGSYRLRTNSIVFPANTPIGRQYLLTSHTSAEGSAIWSTTTSYYLVSPATNGVIDYTRVRTGSNSGTPSNFVNNKEFFLLPGSADNPVAGNQFCLSFDLRIYVEGKESSGPLRSVVTPKIPGTALKKGVRTSYTIKIISANATTSDTELKIQNTTEIVDWQTKETYDIEM